MQVFLDTYRCLDAVEQSRNFAELGYAAPPEFLKASSFSNPLGEAPARGWVLVPRQTLDAIDLDNFHNLTFTDAFGGSVVCYNLVIAREPRKMLPGPLNDASSCYLVELADKRHLLNDALLGIACNTMYNVRAPSYGGATYPYYDSSMNPSGVIPWTWQTMVTDLWDRLSEFLGDDDTLPFEPDGTPEGWQFRGMNAYKALNRILRRLGCAIAYTPSLKTNPYSIVRVGEPDATSDRTIAAAEKANRKVNDAEFLDIIEGKYPGQVVVYFHSTYEAGIELTTPQDTSQWLVNQATAVYVTDSASDAGDTALIHEIWDDLAATYDATDTNTNATAVNSRASERASDFWRMLKATGGGDRLWKVFTGIIKGLNPGSTIKGVTWRQDLGGQGDSEPGGLVTEIVRHPYLMLRTNDAGSFEIASADLQNCQDNISDFGPQFPVYPQLLQVVRVLTATPDAWLKYPMFVERLNPALAGGIEGDPLGYTDGEPGFAYEINGMPLVAQRYLARLTGYSTGPGCTGPLYQVEVGAAGGNTGPYAGSGPVGGWTMLYRPGSIIDVGPGSIFFGYPFPTIDNIGFAFIANIDRNGCDETAVLAQVGSGDQIKFFMEDAFENIYGFYLVTSASPGVNSLGLTLDYLGGAGGLTWSENGLLDWGWEHVVPGSPGQPGQPGPPGGSGPTGPGGAPGANTLGIGTETTNDTYPSVYHLNFDSGQFTETASSDIYPNDTVLINAKFDATGGNIKPVQVHGTAAVGSSGIAPNSDHVHLLEDIVNAAAATTIVATDYVLGRTAADGANVKIPISKLGATSGNIEDDLTPDYAITAMNGVFVDSGIDVVLPAAGTYLLYAVVVSRLNASVSTGSPYAVIRAKLYDSSNSVDVADSLATVNCVDVLSLDSILTGTIVSLYTAGAANTIKLYVARDLGTTYTTSSILGNSTDGTTRIGYMRLA